MVDRIVCGQVPDKPHTALHGPGGELRHEECLTRAGFDGPFTILYRLDRPHALAAAPAEHGWPLPEAAPPRPLLRRHHRTRALSPGGAPVDARVPLLFNADVVVGALRPTASDPAYWVNGDGDDLFYVHEGAGTLRTPLGDLPFGAGDYICIPRGILRRFVLDAETPQHWLSIECAGSLGLLSRWRNEVGQLRMDAPYSHRDFRRPELPEPRDEGLRDLLVKKNGAFHGYRLQSSPLDVVGWDGAVYPWAFPIERFQPKVGLVHLPPTVHGTFEARGVLVCSFVPRPLDFHPEAIPCPYPHSSVDVDEVIFYASGRFTSRRGVESGSLTHHPAGIPHGPHPGAYEGSRGARHTEELAVMLDCSAPLAPTPAALAVEDGAYDASFLE